MKKVYFMMLFLWLVSCKKEKSVDKKTTPKIEITEIGKIILIDSVQLSTVNDSAVLHFYQKNNNRTFWLTDTNRKKIHTILNAVEEEGLFKKDFDLKKIQQLEQTIFQLSDDELVQYDLLLTKNLSLFIHKTAIGKLQSEKLYPDWDLPKNNINLTELLLNFQKKDSIAWAINTVRPPHIVYQKLRMALKIINKLPKEKYQKIELKNKLILRDTNLVLIKIKEKLIFWNDLKPMDSLSPIYDSITELAVKKFKTRHGLALNGVIDAGTINALNFSKKQRTEQIKANMERWRWFPRNLGEEYLIINIPDYTLHTVKNKDTTSTYKIIVGKPARKTPVLSSKINHLILNPTWTIPPTILNKDVIPAIKRNKNYVNIKKITIYDVQNKVVNINDWNPKLAGSYRYVQSPGTHNSLGLVKFMFPNRFSVYLHDTNTRGFFEQEIRTLSSGCIRVQNPFELAEYLADKPEKWNLNTINASLKSGQTIKVSLEKSIPIHILYWTAWSKNGRLQFRDDFYHLDAALYQKIAN